MTLETIMNIEALKTFLVVAEVKNFTKAAQQLFVVQSTITNRIKELEKEIGQPLFDRDNKHITLTHAGEHFYEYSQRFLELEEKMKMEINSCNTYSKIINIGCVNCIYNCHLKPHISQLMNKHTNICLNVILDHSRHLLNRPLMSAFHIWQRMKSAINVFHIKRMKSFLLPTAKIYNFPMVFTTVKYFIYQLSILNLCRKVDLIGYTIFFLHTMYFNLQLV